MNDGARMDFITSKGKGGGFQGSGLVAQRLLQGGFNVNALRTHDTLRKDEWKLYDTALVQIARKNLVGVQDLLSRGLVMRLANALGVTRIEWETVTDMTGADINMSGISESQNDGLEFALTGIPVPIIYKDFNLNIRHLEASRKSGQPLDTMQVEVATRKVVEKVEELLFVGYSGLGSNRPIYGYTTAPNRNTTTSTNSHDWDTDSTGEEMVIDVLAMIDKMVADNMYGPYGIYVSTAAFTRMGGDFKANSDKTIMQRLLEIPGIEFIKQSKDVPAKQQIMVQFSKDVVDMIDGIQPTLVEWDTHAGFVKHFKVICIMLPRVRNDADLQSGIVHSTGS
jgi:uncharacterized linocin/CFP29 family protein